MEDSIFRQAASILRDQKAHRKWLSVLLLLSILVSYGTVSALKLPGVARTHSARVLRCVDEGQLVAHVHNDDCYDEDGELVCPLEERELHQHTEECYTLELVLVCGEEESEGHTHTEECYTRVRGELICDNEDEDHEHDDNCYEWDEELTCGMEEGEGAHTHTEDCYEEQEVLTCGYEEVTHTHVHGEECFVTEELSDEEVEALREREESSGRSSSDPVENNLDWLELADRLDLTGDPAQDIVLIARSQVGYRPIKAEDEDAEEDEDEETDGETAADPGYTRYGAWYGRSHAERWSALFAAFCAHYAGLDEGTLSDDSQRYLESLDKAGLYTARDDAEPQPGMLAFFDLDGDEDAAADHVGIVAEVDGETGALTLIVGDVDGEVKEESCFAEWEALLGYAVLPAAEEEEPIPSGGGAVELEEPEEIGARLDIVYPEDEEIDLPVLTPMAAPAKAPRRAAAADEEVTINDTSIELQKSWLTDVRLNYKGADGVWHEVTADATIHKSDLMQFQMEYEVPAGAMRDADGNVVNTLTYQIPSIIKVVNPVDNGIIYDSENHEVGRYTIDASGQITVKLSDDMVRANIKGLKLAGMVNFLSQVRDIETDGEGGAEFEFSESIKKDITVVEDENPNANDLRVAKTASDLSDDGTITYRITVNSTNGTSEGVTLTDTMSDNVAYQGNFKVEHLSYDENGTLVRENYSNGNPTVTSDNKTITYTLPQMGKNDIYEITYTGKLTDWEIKDGQVTQLKNEVTVKSGGLEPKAEVTTTVNPISKSGQLSGDEKTITWTITIRTYGKDINGYVVDDWFYGTHVDKASLNGEEVGLPYTFPSGSTGPVYTFTVQTEAKEGIGEWASTNTATISPGENQPGVPGTGFTVIDVKEFNPVEKDGVSITEPGADKTSIVTWKVTVKADKGPIKANIQPSEEDAAKGAKPYWFYYDQLGEKDREQRGGTQRFTDQQWLDLQAAIRDAINDMRLDWTENTDYVIITDPAAAGGPAFKITFFRDLPQGKSFTFTYQTTATLGSLSEAHTFLNKGEVNDKKEDWGEVSYTPPLRKFDPKGGSGADTTSYHDYYDTELSLDGGKGSGILRWEVQFHLPDGATAPVILTDQLPAGLTFYSEHTAGDRAGIELRVASRSFNTGTAHFLFTGDDPNTGTWTVNGWNTIEKDENGNDKWTWVEQLSTLQAAYDPITNRITVTLDEDFLKQYRRSGYDSQGTLNFVIFAKIDDFDWTALEETDEIGLPQAAFPNTVTVTCNGITYTDDQTQKITKDDNATTITKFGKGVNDNVLPYSIVINEEGKDLVPESSTVTLKDVLTYQASTVNGLVVTRISLVPGSYKVYRYDPTKADGKGEDLTSQITYTYETNFDREMTEWYAGTHYNGENVITTILPDSTPLLIEYSYKATGPTGAELRNVVNTATLEGVVTRHEEKTTSISIAVDASGATANIKGIIVYKVDSTNNALRLPGAQFKLEKWNGTAYELVKDGLETSSLEERLGKLYLTADNLNTEFIPNVEYRLTETKAPSGYLTSTEEYRFLIYDSDTTKYPPQVNTPNKELSRFTGHVLYMGSEIFFTDREDGATQVNVIKKWVNHNGQEIQKTDGAVTFDLWRKRVLADTVDAVKTTLTTNIATVVKSNFNSGQPYDLYYPEGSVVTYELTLANSEHKQDDYNYAPITLTVDGKTITSRWDSERGVYSFIFDVTVQAGKSVQVTTSKTNFGEIWYGAEKNVTFPDGYAHTEEDERIAAGITLSAADGWKWSSDDLPSTVVIDGKQYRYLYYVKEEAGTAAKFGAVYEGNLVFHADQITITNTVRSMTVQKRWVDKSYNDTTPETDSVQFVLYRRIGDPVAAEHVTTIINNNIAKSNPGGISEAAPIYIDDFPVGSVVMYKLRGIASDNNTWTDGTTIRVFPSGGGTVRVYNPKSYTEDNKRVEEFIFPIEITKGGSYQLNVCRPEGTPDGDFGLKFYGEIVSVQYPIVEKAIPEREDELVGTYTLSAGENWKTLIEDLDSEVTVDGRNYYYYYYVREVDETYLLSYDYNYTHDSDVCILNSPEVQNLVVNKVWKDTSGNIIDPPAENITVQLQQAQAVKGETIPVTVSLVKYAASVGPTQTNVAKTIQLPIGSAFTISGKDLKVPRDIYLGGTLPGAWKTVTDAGTFLTGEWSYDSSTQVYTSQPITVKKTNGDAMYVQVWSEWINEMSLQEVESSVSSDTEGEVTWTDYGSPVTLSSDTGWRYLWADLPEGTYQVVELTVDGEPVDETTVTYTYPDDAASVSNTGTVVITNTSETVMGYELPATGGWGDPRRYVQTLGRELTALGQRLGSALSGGPGAGPATWIIYGGAASAALAGVMALRQLGRQVRLLRRLRRAEKSSVRQRLRPPRERGRYGA